MAHAVCLGRSLGTFKGLSSRPVFCQVGNRPTLAAKGWACQVRRVSGHPVPSVTWCTGWDEAPCRASERRRGVLPGCHVRGLGRWLPCEVRLQDGSPLGGVDGHRPVWTLWEKTTHGTHISFSSPPRPHSREGKQRNQQKNPRPSYVRFKSERHKRVLFT